MDEDEVRRIIEGLRDQLKREMDDLETRLYGEIESLERSLDDDETRWCIGYTSETYSQERHVASDFPPGKVRCRTCYGAYADDWRAARQASMEVKKD